jgi:hypothetical protein
MRHISPVLLFLCLGLQAVALAAPIHIPASCLAGQLPSDADTPPSPSPGNAPDDESEVYLGLRHELLFTRLGIVPERRALASTGVEYWLNPREGKVDLDLRRILLGVHPSAQHASHYFAQFYNLAAVGPTESGDELGTCFAFWGGSGLSSSILIRERNILLVFGGRGRAEEVRHLGERIVDLIRTDHEIAPRGHFEEMPAFASKRLSRLPGSTENRPVVHPGFRGLGNPDRLLMATSRGAMPMQMLPANAANQGRIQLQLPKGQGGPNYFLYAATGDNVFISEEITILPEQD